MNTPQIDFDHEKPVAYQSRRRLGMLVGCMMMLAWAAGAEAAVDEQQRVQPYHENPFYWQYNGKPVVLLGGFDPQWIHKAKVRLQTPDNRPHVALLTIGK
jgi:hypothetical protein